MLVISFGDEGKPVEDNILIRWLMENFPSLISIANHGIHIQKEWVTTLQLMILKTKHKGNEFYCRAAEQLPTIY